LREDNVTHSQKTELSLLLINLKGIGQRTVKNLLKQFNSVEEIQNCDDTTLKKILNNTNFKNTQAIIHNSFEIESSKRKAQHILDLVAFHKMSVICVEDKSYPFNLRRADDCPPILYVKGDMSSLNNPLAIAVVGTREPTPDGVEMAKRITSKFSNYGFIIVSGLALGIDSYAHSAAIESGAKTIAVMGTNLEDNEIYPRKNFNLAKQIISSGGCWISELAPGEKAERNNFALRDRIQSGLSLAVLAIQSDIKGGTMHTVRYAKEQGRAVLSPIPKDKFQSQSKGINMLLDEGTALGISSRVDYPIIAKELIKISNEQIDVNQLNLNSYLIEQDLKENINVEDFNNRISYFSKISNILPFKKTKESKKKKSLSINNPAEKLNEKLVKLLNDIKDKKLINEKIIQSTLKDYIKNNIE